MTPQITLKFILPGLCALAIIVSHAPAAEISGVKLPDQLTVAGKSLKLNGTALRQATILKVNVYAAGLYLEKTSGDGEAVANSDQAKSIEMMFMRDASAKQMAEAFGEGFEKNCVAGCAELKPFISKLQGLMKDMKKGETMAFHFLADGVEVMIRGQKMVVPGDGSSLWVITHNTDFAKGLVGLVGHQQAIGQAFHITSDEVLTWDQLFRIVGAAVGVEPQLVHIPSDFIAACLPDKKGTLIGDKSVSVVFDNSKIKRFVPGYCATTSFAEGVRQSLAWFNADPARKQIDQQVNATMDKLISAYEKGMSEAVRGFARRT